MAHSTTLKNAMLDWSVGDNPSLTPSSIQYCALYVTAPTTATAGTEPSWTNYARVTCSAGTWSAASGGTKTNAVDITFAAHGGGSAEDVLAAGLHDNLTSGNYLQFGNLATTKTVASAETFKIAAGALILK